MYSALNLSQTNFFVLLDDVTKMRKLKLFLEQMYLSIISYMLTQTLEALFTFQFLFYSLLLVTF